MIVGTAGHIDHGKTALVRALTGTDTDRLPEEKRRGITIELGYAFMDAPASAQGPGERIGFVDVPGHEKLVRTMVAGASGIDFALLLVAADDGIMPQTLEHLSVLRLLGISRGAAAVTKIDRVDAATLAGRRQEARALLDDAGLTQWPVLAVSSLRGDGVDELRTYLTAQARTATRPVQPGAGLRMALDRVFSLDGIGTVVAGSVAAGAVSVGDGLCLAHAPRTTWRVRSLQVHGQPVERAVAGQRCAIGLAGLERSAVARGQTLCDPAIAQQSDRFDAWLTVAADAPALKSGARVHLHLGTQECLASIAVLGQDAIAAGASALVQIVPREPVAAWQADRFVLRDASASRTLAGGRVLDTAAPARYRQTPQRLALLDALARAPDAAARLHAVLAHAPHGVSGPSWLRGAGLLDWPFDPAASPGIAVGEDGWLIAQAHLDAMRAQVLNALRAFHDRWPDEIGPDLQRARRLAAPRMPEPAWALLVSRMQTEGQVALRGGFVHLPSHGEQLRAADRAIAEQALPRLLQGRFDPPWVRDIAADARLPETQLRQVLARLAGAGEVFQIVKDLYYHPRAVMELAAIARGIAAEPPMLKPGAGAGQGRASALRAGEITAARFRDATGLGRKRAIQVLEFFDRVGLLRRHGDAHLLRPGATLFSGEDNPPAAHR